MVVPSLRVVVVEVVVEPAPPPKPDALTNSPTAFGSSFAATGNNSLSSGIIWLLAVGLRGKNVISSSTKTSPLLAGATGAGVAAVDEASVAGAAVPLVPGLVASATPDASRDDTATPVASASSAGPFCSALVATSLPTAKPTAVSSGFSAITSVASLTFPKP